MLVASNQPILSYFIWLSLTQAFPTAGHTAPAPQLWPPPLLGEVPILSHCFHIRSVPTWPLRGAGCISVAIVALAAEVPGLENTAGHPRTQRPLPAQA